MSDENWPIEEIPDEDLLYYRVHARDIREGQVLPGAFKERGDGEERGMSVDWNRYAKPDRLIQVAKDPNKNGVGQFNVGEVRKKGKPDLTVYHCPISDNQSHSHIKGIPNKGVLKTTVRAKLLKMFEWTIPPPNVWLNDEEQ